MSTVVERQGSPSGLTARAADRPARQPSSRILRTDLRAIMGEGAAFNAMVGVGENYLPAFALAMGLGQVAAGLITTIPLMVGAVLQLISPWAVRRLRSHRRWVFLCAAVQAGSFLPLCLGAVLGRMPMAAVFAVAAVYFGAGLAASSAWSTWAETLVPEQIRARYFARRTRVGQLALLVGFVVGGASLQIGTRYDQRLAVFAVLFLLAALSRGVSAFCLATQSEPLPLPKTGRSVPMREFFARIRSSGDGRLLFYFLSVQAAAQIAGPYFTSYMLGPMQLSYTSYVTLMAVCFTAKALALPALGGLAERLGTRRLLWLGGLGIVPISGLWIISNRFEYLVCVQILSGVTWATYELAMLLLFFETIRPAERTSVLTSFNFANSLATAAGSLLGGGLLAFFGKHQQVYLALFAISSVARAATLISLARVPKFSRDADWLATEDLEARETVPIVSPSQARVANWQDAA